MSCASPDTSPGAVHPLRTLLREAAPDDAARIVLGGTLSHGPVTLRIVEVEAYGGPPDSDFPDPAAHTWPGLTPRNEVMFGDAGHLYVYLSHGIHQCVNITCRPAGEGGGVLLRAARVEVGHDVVELRRPGIRPRFLARGPGNLGRSLGIDLSYRGRDVLSPSPSPSPSPSSSSSSSSRSSSSSSCLSTAVTFRPDPVPPRLIATGPRVGVSREADRPWRFWIAGAPEVSAYRRSPRAPAPVRRAGGSDRDGGQ